MRKTSLFAVFMLAFSLLTMAQSIDTIPKPATSRDSIIQNEDWSIRTPLSEEELQKREDNRARLARMKQRFRNFHDSEEEIHNKSEQEAEESGFLWSDAQEGGQNQEPETITKGDVNTAEDESLRLEISRNLQYNKSANTSPPAPVSPNIPEQSPPAPEAYDQAPAPRINTNTTEIQRDIKSAFQNTNNQVTPAAETVKGWQTEVSTTSDPEPQEELTFTTLSAGQSYRLDVTFTDQGNTLNTESFTHLNTWASWLKQHPEMRVETRAYTHHEIDALDAIDLSIQRAKIITDYWLAQGALEQQLAYRGYGSLSPLVPNTDPLAKQKNERIEVIILELPPR